MTSLRTLRNQAGSSLIEALVAVAIFGFLFASGASLLSYGGAKLGQQRLKETRSRLVATLKRVAGTPAALRSAAVADPSIEPFNDQVRACVNGGNWTIPCNNRNIDGNYLPFRMYLPMVANTQDSWGQFALKTSGAITGIPLRPMRYTAMGRTCDSAIYPCPPKDFPIEAFTEFLPICPPLFEAYYREWTNEPLPNPVYPDGLKPIAQCPFARYMKIRLTIRPSDPNMDPVLRTQLSTVEVVTIDNALARAARQ
jgi:type II secretory pathway pseudopilin PulG